MVTRRSLFVVPFAAIGLAPALGDQLVPIPMSPDGMRWALREADRISAEEVNEELDAIAAKITANMNRRG